MPWLFAGGKDRSMSRFAKILVGLGVVIAAIVAWWAMRRRPAQASPAEADVAWDRLVAFDTARRHGVDFAKVPTWDKRSGPDPYALRAVPDTDRLVGILRGSDAVVVLDASLREIQRLDAPAGPVALAIAPDRTVYVAGEFSSSVARYAWKDGALAPAGTTELAGARAIRDLAAAPNGFVYAVEEHEGRLLAFRPARDAKTNPPLASKLCNGPVSLQFLGDFLAVDCLLDHALLFVKLDPTGAPSREPPLRIAHDGPIWSFAVHPVGIGEFVVAVGGVEDHPLDRTIGAFGYVDSFLYLYTFDAPNAELRREAAVNLSELGVVTPKAIAFEPSTPSALTLRVTGYASDKILWLGFEQDRSRATRVVTTSGFVPGATAVARLADGALAFADPLLDAWVRVSWTGVPEKDGAVRSEVVPVVSQAPRSDTAERIGEALFFTTWMAPFNRSDGPLSRFTCETCHFEGYVDGRVHHTGRGDVHAVTKPLLGLWNNRPHFSRALDDDLVAVAFNEFRVAGAKSDHDPWFDLPARDVPWVSHLGYADQRLSAEYLRKALMSFLMAFNHRPNPMVIGKTSFSDQERDGAALFRDKCESCHEARLASDIAPSRVPFEKWESLVLAREGAIVWGKASYEKTGVEPYVHENGARVPSLRRLYKKHPYFTNGAAKSLDDVLTQARFLPEGFRHAPPKPERGATLDERSRAALLSFLDLL
jgi:hypothetical protein